MRQDGVRGSVMAMEDDARLEWTQPVLRREDPRDAESGANIMFVELEKKS